MRVRPFIQGDGTFKTIGRIQALLDFVRPTKVLFCFAYATSSGCAEFQRRFGNGFWERHETSWLLGIDYGRTQPAALDFIESRPNTTVKLANAAQVVAATSFFPAQDFHIKACFAYNPRQHRYGLIVGSGNFSRNGLVDSIEGGTLLTVKNEGEFRATLRGAFLAAEGLWNSAEDLDAHIDAYKERWVPQAVRPIRRAAPTEDEVVETPEDVDLEEFEFLWFDPGYVTKNRGPNLPGNQIDLPRGVHRFFELDAGANPERNSEIGEITFVFPVEEVTRVLRFGNNMMEKITLPMPDRYGLGAYDGMVVEFQRVDRGYVIKTFEMVDYLDIHRGEVGSFVFQMGSGRLYGVRGPLNI